MHRYLKSTSMKLITLMSIHIVYPFGNTIYESSDRTKVREVNTLSNKSQHFRSRWALPNSDSCHSRSYPQPIVSEYSETHSDIKEKFCHTK